MGTELDLLHLWISHLLRYSVGRTVPLFQVTVSYSDDDFEEAPL